MSQSENQQTSFIDEQFNKNKSELSNLSVRDLFYKYVRFMPLILLSVALSLLIGFAYLRYATRIYSANGTLLIKSEQSKGGSDKVEDLLSGGNKTQNIQSEIEILKSRPLMTRVVNKLNLQFSYFAKGTIIKSLNVYKQGPFIIEAFELADSSASFSMGFKFIGNEQFHVNGKSELFNFGQLFRNGYGVFRLVKNGAMSSTPDFTVVRQPPEVVASSLVGGLKILPKTPGTGILSISFSATNGYMASDIVNSLMIQYDSLTIEQNNYSTSQMLGFIEQRLDKLKHEIDSVQDIGLKFRQKYHLFDVETQSAAFLEKLDEGNKAISEQGMRIEEAAIVENYIKDKQNQFNRVVPSSLRLEDLTLISLIDQYNKAQLDRQILVNSNIPIAHPAIRQAEAVIEKQRENLLENLKNIRFAYLNEVGAVQKKIVNQQVQLEAMPSQLKELLEIESQVATKQALASLLEQKREEAAIQRASTISNSKIMDVATPTTVPVKPNKRAIQILAILVGLGIPALAIFMSEVLNDKVTTRFDIEKLTRAPILGEVGHSYSEKVLIVNETSRSMVAEQFRIIRSNLQYVLNKAENPVILVTSSFSGEGKSFVSTNMGSVLALTGKRTVILEFDIRKPKVLSGLGMVRRSGISNYLVGKADLAELITPVEEHKNLFVIACGPVPPNPSELLLDKKVAEMFAWLRNEFEVIIIDTAPVGMVSDAMTLGKFADCTLYLVRQGHTFKKQIALIDEIYSENKLPKVSIVINDVKIKPGYGYYGYGRYGYGYGYGQSKASTYYDEETPPTSWFDRFLSKFSFRRLFGRKKK